MVKITEIFHSIQGESTYAGRPCVFVRLTGCPLRYTWCDTAYAFYGGRDMTIDDIVNQVRAFNCDLVEVTGGEPLSQTESLPLLSRLCDEGFEVLVEALGAQGSTRGAVTAGVSSDPAAACLVGSSPVLTTM